MSVPDREADENRIFRVLTVVVCDLQAKCPRISNTMSPKAEGFFVLSSSPTELRTKDVDMRQNTGFHHAVRLLRSKERSQSLDRLWVRQGDGI